MKVDRNKLSSNLVKERELYLQRNQKSLALFNSATNLFGQVPMTWMNKWAGGFPIY
jgi:glutamate-1-semialdehyde 2,1-aminomutase